MSETKIQIKVGIVEFSGEGNQDWLATHLDKILEKIPELLKIEMTNPQAIAGRFATNNQNIGANGSNQSQTGSSLQLSVASIATKLNAKSGQDVALAAAACLNMVKGKKSFTRSEILETMKDATGYYKNTYNKNLTNILGGMLKSTLTESSKGTYSLQAEKEKELHAVFSK